jgi:NlpC/P60 family/S-layer homology domain
VPEMLTEPVPTKASVRPSDRHLMRRFALLVSLLAFVAPAGAAAEPPEPEAAVTTAGRSWATPEIQTVVAAGAMAPTVAAFRPDEPLTRAELHEALTAIGLPVAPPSDPGRLVSIRELDARLVAAGGLLSASRSIRLGVTNAGLAPPDLVGTETVARLLGLRINHPQSQEWLELAPRQPATRAEAAYSLARLLSLTDAEKAGVAGLAGAFALPALTEWQRKVLGRAVRFVGHPYVWAGMSEWRQLLYYGEAPGGFDCSGLVWRVYKLEPFGDGVEPGQAIRGRTTYSMSAEMRKADRILLPSLQPGDLVFFGAQGIRSRPSEVNHMGIYAGNGWFVHASGNGVTLQPLQGWYLQRFAWGRRLLAEVGLS